MAATVQIGEKNGTAGTFTDKTSGTVRFKNADNATVDLLNPMVKGTATDFSYEKYLRMKVTAAPAGNVSNAKLYTDGTSGFGAGVNLWVKQGTYPTGGPAEGTGTSGYINAFNYTSGGSQLDLVIGTQTGTGECGTHAVLLMEVGTGATGGLLSGETLTLQWDEI